MQRGKRLFAEDLYKMDGQKVLGHDKSCVQGDDILTVVLSHSIGGHRNPFPALVDGCGCHYRIEDIAKNNELCEVYELVECGKTIPKTRGFEFISKNQFEIDFKKAGLIFMKYEDLKLPKRATKKSAGYDCFTPIPFTLKPNEEIKIPTGVRSYMQDDEVLFAHVRSGHGFKYARLANSTGVIDCDYYYTGNEGHIWIKIRNEGTEDLKVGDGEGMCQLIFQKYLLADEDNFEKGEDRAGGFGSTTK